ncbi:major facilitator superfamily domain-containing protein [Cercophora newfieldiana]|uniref:Major facilitator superfamily domain-containing protein n=1 Tax=Cercophora newfieldiana TaxID=92897 RepID=A0AA39Y9I3_9PEZI|nr:major facilitator superfamily domain-containing protein [Cercophora newfieldiana]
METSEDPEKKPEAPQEPLDEQDVAHERLRALERNYGSTWDSPTDPEDPYNWPSLRKISIGLVFSFGHLVTLMSASMIAAALKDIERDLSIDATTAQIIFSTYFLGLALGPFPIAAWSEMGGRKQVWLFANAWFILWNALCPVGRSKGLMVAGRLMTGVGASAGITLTGPVMADMYRNEDRGKSLAIASFLPYLGPALGPILGGVVSHLVDWPWIFWIMSIINAAVTLLGLVCIRETYTPELLRRKAIATGSQLPAAEKHNSSAFIPKLRSHLARPFLLLMKRPVIQVMAFLLALDFAVYTFLLSTFAMLYMQRYGQSQFISSLHYLSISVGFTVAAQVGGRAMDAIYSRLSRGKNGRPELRIPYMVPGVLLIPAGLLWYGWSAQARVHWASVDAGAVVFTVGSLIVSQALFAYQLDEFAEHGASANAASRVFSNLLAFVFPIFAPRLYDGLGFGWGNSLLAGVWFVLVGPMPVLLWFWGERLRALGRKGGENPGAVGL